jgi:hypothetical protein
MKVEVRAGGYESDSISGNLEQVEYKAAKEERGNCFFF